MNGLKLSIQQPFQNGKLKAETILEEGTVFRYAINQQEQFTISFEKVEKDGAKQGKPGMDMSENNAKEK